MSDTLKPMAVNQSRDMVSELHQGIIDNTYIQLAPNRGGVHPVEVERLSWPTYQQAERHGEHPFATHPEFLGSFDEATTMGTPTTRRSY